MAITATGTNPIVVTGTTAASDDILVTDRRVVVEAVYWLTPTTAAQKLALQDGAGAEKLELSVLNDGESVYFHTPIAFNGGIYCDDMDSGTLYVFLRIDPW